MSSLAKVADLIDLHSERYAWRAHGACRTRPDLTWFPGPGESISEQRAICETCPVKAICLEVSLANREDHGIWGGLSERERRRLRRQRAQTTTTHEGPTP